MISKKDIEYTAALARLEFSEEEKEKCREQLNVILEYAALLNELDTADIKPAYHVMPAHNVTRKDEAKPSLEKEKVLMNAPDTKGGCFKVPRIIE